MIRIKAIILLFLLLSCKQSKGGDDNIPVEDFFNQTISYQGGYDSKLNYLNAFDYNAVFLWYNCGYNYQFSYGHKIFMGLGFLGIAQLQTGYAFNTKDFLLRYRSDFTISSIEYFFIPVKKLEGGGWRKSRQGKLRYCSSTIGFFAESRFNNGYKSMSIGVTLGISIWDIRRVIKAW